jgi:hypothetical protein
MFGGKPAGVLIAAVVLAVSGFATTTAASAAVFELTNNACPGGTTAALCYYSTNLAGVLGSWELEGEQSVTIKGGTTRATVPSLETLTIQCNSSTSAGEPVILQHSPLGNGLTTLEGAKLTTQGCKLTAPASAVEKCEIPAENTTNNLLGSLESTTNLNVSPESGTTFLEIEFKNKSTLKCPAAFTGKLHIHGTQLFTISNAGNPELTKKGIAEVKSGLLFGEENGIEIEKEIEIEFLGLRVFVFVRIVI